MLKKPSIGVTETTLALPVSLPLAYYAFCVQPTRLARDRIAPQKSGSPFPPPVLLLLAVVLLRTLTQQFAVVQLRASGTIKVPFVGQLDLSDPIAIGLFSSFATLIVLIPAVSILLFLFSGLRFPDGKVQALTRASITIVALWIVSTEIFIQFEGALFRIWPNIPDSQMVLKGALSLFKIALGVVLVVVVPLRNLWVVARELRRAFPAGT